MFLKMYKSNVILYCFAIDHIRMNLSYSILSMILIRKLITFTESCKKLILAYSSIGIGYVSFVRKYEV